MSSNLEDVQIVIETIDSAINARFQLSHLLDGVSEAKNQVVSMYCSYRASPVTSRAGTCDPLAAVQQSTPHYAMQRGLPENHTSPHITSLCS